MKILIAYYTRTGNTERVAKDLAKKLEGDLEPISDKKRRTGIWGWILGGRDAMKKELTEIGPQSKDPTRYDLVILGSPVWSWTLVPAIRTYVEHQKKAFNNMAFFVTSGDTDAAKLQKAFEEASGKKMLAFAGFNTAELKDKETYAKKMDAFAQQIKSLNP